MKRLTAVIMLIITGAIIFASNTISFSGRYALVGTDGRTIRRTSTDIDGTGVVLATGEEKATAKASAFTLVLGENSLAAIKDEDSYGYRIVKDMAPYVEISESTLYPILRRLEAAELLSVRTAEHNGRLRKYYHITPAGLERIEQFKNEWSEIMAIYQYITREEK